MASPASAQFIVITGGVLSGIGKGVLTASIGSLLSNSDLKIVPIKCDGYLNADPGTMNPIEHGEVFVLDDGGEVDMDFGHYERFFSVTARKEWNITMGKIYKQILDNERKGKYLGKTVQLIPHATDQIKKNIYGIANREKAGLILLEIGGTVGDMENELFIESVRQIRNEMGQERMMFIHVTYVPFIAGSKELKSKPTQNSVKALHRHGVYPDMIVCRSSIPLNEEIKRKISLYCNIKSDHVISGVDVENINILPLYFDREGMTQVIKKRLNLKVNKIPKEKIRLIEGLQQVYKMHKDQVRIAICGKYTHLEDSYASIGEALVHCEANLKTKIDFTFINTSFTKEETPLDYLEWEKRIAKLLQNTHGVIIPGGFGLRGIEGKISIIRYVRENRIPFLGICLGMQLAVIEFARNCCGMTGAHSREVVGEKDIPYPVIDFLPGQRALIAKGDWGGTMRLGGANVLLKPGTRAAQIYGQECIRERFRHRYEVNPRFLSRLEKHGLIFSGMAKNKRIRKIAELPSHPFFMGSQFHPELISRLDRPAPLFLAFIKACMEERVKKEMVDE